MQSIIKQKWAPHKYTHQRRRRRRCSIQPKPYYAFSDGFGANILCSDVCVRSVRRCELHRCCEPCVSKEDTYTCVCLCVLCWCRYVGNPSLWVWWSRRALCWCSASSVRRSTSSHCMRIVCGDHMERHRATRAPTRLIPQW